MVFIPIVVFIFGLIIGSFLNVVILRMNTGRSIANGRSKCPRCNTTLSWYHLVPVVSFLGLRGKCANCKSRISFQYPLVELITAIVFTFIYTAVIANHGFTLVALLVFIFSITVASLLIVIFVYDIKHTIIPDMIVYLFIISSLISIVWSIFTVAGFQPGMALVDGVLVALPFFLLWAFSKGRAMGFGDVKLALGIGWLLGLAAGFSVVFFGFLIGRTLFIGHYAQIPFAFPNTVCAIFNHRHIYCRRVGCHYFFPL
jgi:leader peptidase (prepilin peptidase)/N-methyltransferase